MDAPLSILYTHDLRGDLEMLPRLYTFIKQLRAQAQRFEDDSDVMVCQVQPPARRTLLVDVGNCCAGNVWHCNITGGRSMVIALDAMGYDAVMTAGMLFPTSREQLEATVQQRLVYAGHPVERGGVIFAFAPLRDVSGLQLVMQPRAEAALEGTLLYPAALRAGQVGILHLTPSGGLRLSAHHVFDLPPNTRPDPTIAGAVDFVLGEARHYQKKQTS